MQDNCIIRQKNGGIESDSFTVRTKKMDNALRSYLT